MSDQSSTRGTRRWLIAAAVTVVVLTGTALAAGAVLRTRYAVPSTDLIGTPGPATGWPAASPAASPTARPGADLTGPLDILLVGIDPRESQPGWEPHADAVLILHVTRSLDQSYLFSLPRDLVVDIPAFEPAGYAGGRTKLTHAMSYGSRHPDGGRPDADQGFQLLARTVADYTGIDGFDAGVVLNFRGFQSLVDAVDGVDMYVDQRVTSIHRKPDGTHREPGRGGYVGPQMVYEVGPHHFSGWQALDFARQRYTEDGDYARQRHHQQLIKALLWKVASLGLATDPVGLDRVLTALDDTFVFDGQDHSPVDFAFALHGLTPQRLTLIGLPGRGVGSGANYRGEQLDPVGREFLDEFLAGRTAAFLADHPELVIDG